MILFLDLLWHDRFRNDPLTIIPQEKISSPRIVDRIAGTILPVYLIALYQLMYFSLTMLIKERTLIAESL